MQNVNKIPINCFYKLFSFEMLRFHLPDPPSLRRQLPPATKDHRPDSVSLTWLKFTLAQTATTTSTHHINPV